MPITIPTKMPVAWAEGASAPYVHTVPIPSQIGVTPGRASFTDGFVPLNFTAISAGGIPPSGDDSNGVLQAVTQWLRWIQAGGSIAYDSAFQSAIGGYPLGATVADPTTAGLYWFNSTANNTTDPTAGGAGWTPLALASGGVASTGDWKWRPTQEVLPGWVKANATTIGNASSGATQLADAAALPLFKWFWTNFPDGECLVSPGPRGANPTADFNANKTIRTLDMRGVSPIGMDTMGGNPTTILNGVPVQFGSPTSAGSFIGEVLHQLLTTELAQHNHGVNDPTHNHGVNDPTHFHQIINSATAIAGTVFATTSGVGAGFGTATTDSRGTGVTIQNSSTGITTQNNGSNVAHNTVQLSITGTHYFKL